MEAIVKGQARGAPERLVQARAESDPKRSARERSEHGRNGSEAGDPRQAPRHVACRQQAPSDERGPERPRRGLPVGPAAGVRRCNRPQ